MIRSRLYRCLAPIICLGLIAGCWDRKEINEIALVMASGLDLAEDGQIEATLQIALPAATGRMQAGGATQKPVMVITGKGISGQEALNRLQEHLSRKIFLGHRGIIIVGEQYARHGIDRFLDGFMRSPESRYTSYILTSHGMTAKEVLQSPYLMEQIPAIGMKKMQSHMGVNLAVRIDEFMRDLASDGKSPSTGVIRIENNESAGKVFIMDEAAVYQKHKLVGFLMEDELRVVLWWRGESKRGRIAAQVEPKEEAFHGTISIGIINVHKKIRIKIKNGKPEVSVTLKAKGRILENDTKLDLGKEQILKQVESKLADDIRQMFIKTFKKVQHEYQADIFGLGEEVHIKHPYYWKENKDRWKDIYPQVPVTVQVEITLTRTGRAQAPPHLEN